MTSFTWAITILFWMGVAFNFAKRQHEYAVLNGLIAGWGTLVLLNQHRLLL